MVDVRSMKTIIDNADRISALPEPLLQHIMLFLPFKDAVRTRILSKIWEKAWRTFPVLNFDEILFERELLEMMAALDDVQKFNQARGKLLNYWKQALETHRHHCSSNKLSVEKLTFKASFLDDSEFADQCVCYAIERELELDIILWDGRLYHLTQMVFCSESLNVLDLFGCKLLEFPRSNSVKLPSLRKLKLAQVHASDQVIENLVAGCPLIEDLSFQFCKGFKSIKLFGHSKLADIKVSDIRELEDVNINALNARLISVLGRVKINVVACENLKVLFLCMTSVVDESLSDHITRLAVLECLGLAHCFKLQNIKISSPSLKLLEIYQCMNLAAVEIETPNLSKYKYNGDIVPFSSSTALKLLETNLNLYTRNYDHQWYFKFIELTAKFHQWSKVLNLLSDSGESVIIPKELRQILPPPLSVVKHLNFSITLPWKSFAIAQVLDGLLWMSPHVDTLTIDYGRTFNKFYFQILYKDEVVSGGGVETAQCCKSVPVLCWGHCIQKIEVEMTSKDMDCNSARMVFEDEDILKKINGLGDLMLKNKTPRWIYED